ncbi:MAG: hypothetical protein H6523_12935 [Mycolicibacterium sp.]|nr:hypothetical protein [Mycolicibacterium sp.]
MGTGGERGWQEPTERELAMIEAAMDEAPDAITGEPYDPEAARAAARRRWREQQRG